ncbi:restriction endonuclease subunit S [Halogeometricum sp. S1BR25-6]|uniref:Restriction endonuclease subunit S n=1 Tax=Halogeometricum salsisoli TaxID=2950536 RepID=A0ABU2GEY0_9EURY|nr:restriction endonuclease subunit S [Halogeometricum sp. S1BR25-6]MDS0299366.1 restriction endonuclease subunit S [Halogeometricum sp. S1BR25-6]
MSEALEQSDLREGYEEVQLGPKTFIVPSDWSTERFGNVYQRRRASVDDLEDGEIRYVGLKHLDSGQLKINGYDEDGRERSSSRVFRKGDVLFGKLRPNLNKAAIAPFSGVCSSDIIPLYAKEDTHQQYLPHLMHSKLIRDRVVSTMEGTNLPRTSWKDLEKTLIPLPSLPEQRRIADILSTVEEQIQQTDGIIETRTELREGLLQNLLKNGIGHNKYNSLRVGPISIQVPKSWELEAIDDIILPGKDGLRGGPPGSRIKKGNRVEQGYKIYVQDHVINDDFSLRDDYISEDKFEQLESAAPIPGDVLVTRRGTIGKSTVFPENAKEGIISDSLIRIRPDSVCLPEFLSLVINSSNLIRLQIQSLSYGSSRKGLNNKIVKQLIIPLPPIEEQEEIIEMLSVVNRTIDLENERRSQLSDLKRGLMQDLLTGKVRVKTD